MVSSISKSLHDIRDKANGILFSLDLLRDELEKNGKADELLHLMLMSCEEMQSLLKNLKKEE